MHSNNGYFVINEDYGTVNIAKDVIGNIVMIACMETEGVAGMAASQSSGEKGVSITENAEGGFEVDAHVMMRLGAEIGTAGEKLQVNIKNALESATGITLSRVNVYIAGIKTN